jgi:uncharacterized membrane protein
MTMLLSMKVVFHISRIFKLFLALLVLLISSYFTTCAGGTAGYVVVVEQDMRWGKSKNKGISAQLELELRLILAIMKCINNMQRVKWIDQYLNN